MKHDDRLARSDNPPVAGALDQDPLETAREYGIDLGLINSLLDLPVIERIRRNDADALLDRSIGPVARSRPS